MPESELSPLSLSERLKATAASSRLKPGAESLPMDSLDDQAKRVGIDDQKTDTALKSLYAKRFIWILVGQLVVMNAVFLGVGIGCLKFDEPTYLNLYMGGTLAEVFGIVFVITKYLFSKRSANVP